jgi:RimJ/RimL family protein N-acetyltransferase
MSAIRLVPFGPQHLPGLQSLVDDPSVRRYTRVPEPVPDDFVESWVDRYERGRIDKTRMNFAIEDADDDHTFLGLALAPEMDLDERTAELGYVLAAAARGRGVATAALRQMTTWAFEDQEMIRLQLLISVANDASKQVAKRCGYQFEGVLRGLYFKQDLREDTESWSRLSTDS